MKITIGIAYHKNAEFYRSDMFIPIQVGSAVNCIDLKIQKDSDGENISILNPYCSEMSATYWLWKNVKADYKGLFHYRRFLTFQKSSAVEKIKKYTLYYLSKAASVLIRDSRYEMPTFSEFHIEEACVSGALEKFSENIQRDIDTFGIDCYAMRPLKNSTRTIKTHMILSIGTWHTNTALKIIEECYPSFYPYVERLLQGGKICAYNMLIAKDLIFDKYCNLMFDILHKYHSVMNQGLAPNQINNAMLRDSGYVAEIITGAYIEMLKDKGYKVKFLNCTFVDMEVEGMSSVTPSLLTRVKQQLKL